MTNSDAQRMSFAHAAVLNSDLMTTPKDVPFQNTGNVGLMTDSLFSTAKRNRRAGTRE
jgi:hypothetical protein